jgi:microcystin-dependent protein
MPATTTEGTGPGSVEEIRNKIQNSVVKEENLFPPEMLMPVGVVLPYTSSTAPSGWLNCLGQELYRGDYPDLFAVIGTTYGVGNGTTTFNLPNLAGRTVVGQGTGSGLTARSMGATGGVETHALNINEMPSHTHDVSNTVQKSGFNTPDGLDNGGAEIDTVTTVSTTSTSQGSGVAHNNMQPFAVLNYIIRYGNKA